MDVASKNLDNNDRYSYEGQSEDMHTWFFLYDDKLASKHDTTETHKQVKASKNHNVFQQQTANFFFDYFRCQIRICAPVHQFLILKLSGVSRNDLYLAVINCYQSESTCKELNVVEGIELRCSVL